MNKKAISTASAAILMTILSVACATTLTPAITALPTSAPTEKNIVQTENVTFEAKTVEGGSVTISTKPKSLGPNQPWEFEIWMNTHSVDLNYDMLKSVVLRDDLEKEYAPITWDGEGSGGHHRSGIIKFAPLTSKAIKLIVKNVAGVPERVFEWNIPSK